jgi:hypothetical protein
MMGLVRGMLAVIFSGEIATPRLRAKTNSLG